MNRYTQLIKRIHRLFTTTNSPIYLVWNPFAKRTPVQRIRCLANRYQFHHYPHALRLTIKYTLVLWWPVRLLVLILSLTRRYGSNVKRRTGKGLCQQLIEQVKLAVVYFISPLDYYLYSDHPQPQHLRAGAYLNNHERAGLGWVLNAHPGQEAINDKAAFAHVCAQYGLASPPIWATTDRHGIELNPSETEGALPLADLFCKPVTGAKGEGSVALFWDPAGHYRRHDGRRLSQRELTACLLQLGQERPYIVQPYLRNHADLAGLANGALATARLVTGRRTDGEITVIAATFKMPLAQAITNTHGLNSAIHLDTGQLDRGYRYTPGCPGHSVHPDSGAPIIGTVLPFWPNVLALAIRAHQTFTSYVFLGWDIALTPLGPVVLEGNVGWDVPTVQMPQRVPLGQTRFVEICLAHMELGNLNLR